MILLDADIATLLFYGRNERVLARYKSALENERPALTIITRIEILRGRFEAVMKAASKEEWLQAQVHLHDTERWVARIEIVHINATAADHFERLRLNKKLKKIGRADLMTGCITLANDATLVTRNTKDFKLIPQVRELGRLIAQKDTPHVRHPLPVPRPHDVLLPVRHGHAKGRRGIAD